MTYIYDFSHKHRRPPMELKDLLGGKGANLAEMTSVLRLPVPPGFTISTDACRAYMKAGWPRELDGQVFDWDDPPDFVTRRNSRRRRPTRRRPSKKGSMGAPMHCTERPGRGGLGTSFPGLFS